MSRVGRKPTTAIEPNGCGSLTPKRIYEPAPHVSVLMEVKRTVPVKLDVLDERRDDLHATIEQFNDVIRIA